MAAADQIDLAFNAGFEAGADWVEKLEGKVGSGALPSEEAVVAFRAANADHHVLDTAELVCFYEQDFYPLSNFSAFGLWWQGLYFPTVEHAYHWSKFQGPVESATQAEIRRAISAHEAFKLGQEHRDHRRANWDEEKVGVMLALLRIKVEQHEYVRRKLIATGSRELVENSWRDDFWGWGPNRDGQNVLGRLWMKVRGEVGGAPGPEDVVAYDL